MNTPEMPRQKVLIVDDEAQNIKILGEALRPSYDIFIATQGENALQIAKEQQPDLVLLNIVMPDLNGYELLKRLKDDLSTEAIPVVFITSRDREADEEQGLNAGAVDYITKPFSLPIVQARVRTHLEFKRSHDTLAFYAMYDGLTGVLTRRRFDELLASEWNRCLRYALPLSMILIDIDFFKHYNDHYGHPAGDVCLTQVAHAISSTLKRASDFLARYGGEEFVIVLAGTDEPGAECVARRMLPAVAELKIPHAYSEAAEIVSISLGIATVVPKREASPDVLIQLADKRLYHAKRTGRNRYSTFNGT